MRPYIYKPSNINTNPRFLIVFNIAIEQTTNPKPNSRDTSNIVRYLTKANYPGFTYSISIVTKRRDKQKKRIITKKLAKRLSPFG